MTQIVRSSYYFHIISHYLFVCLVEPHVTVHSHHISQVFFQSHIPLNASKASFL